MSEKFKRQSWWIKKLGKSWRKPRGHTNKVRQEIKGHARMPTVGYRKPVAERGLHPSGLREFMVFNVNDVAKVDPKTNAVRISGGVGMRKRVEIVKACEARKVHVLNPGKKVEK